MDFIKKFDYKKIWANISRSFYYLGRSPLSDWKLFVIIFAVLTLLIFSFGIYTYFVINADDFFIIPSEDSLGVEKINTGVLFKAIGIYQTKENKFNSILQNGVVVSDPSI